MSARQIAIPVNVFWAKSSEYEQSVRDITNPTMHQKVGKRINRDRVTVAGRPWLQAKDAVTRSKEHVVKPSNDPVSKLTSGAPVVKTSDDNLAGQVKLVTLRDLCAEDKKKVANLIRELAKYGEEKESAMDQLHKITQDYQHRIELIEREKERAIKEQDMLKEKLLEYKIAAKKGVTVEEPVASNVDEVCRENGPSNGDLQSRGNLRSDRKTFAHQVPMQQTYYYLGKADVEDAPDLGKDIHVPVRNIHHAPHIGEEDLVAQCIVPPQTDLLHQEPNASSYPAPCASLMQRDAFGATDDTTASVTEKSSSQEGTIRSSLIEHQLKLQSQQECLQNQLGQLQRLQESLIELNTRAVERQIDNSLQRSAHVIQERFVTTSDVHNGSQATDKSAHSSVFVEDTPNVSTMAQSVKDASCQVETVLETFLQPENTAHKQIVSRHDHMAEAEVGELNLLPVGHSVGSELLPQYSEKSPVFAQRASVGLHDDVNLKTSNQPSIGVGKVCQTVLTRSPQTANPKLDIYDTILTSRVPSLSTSAVRRRHFQPSSMLELADGLMPTSTSTSLGSTERHKHVKEQKKYSRASAYKQTVALNMPQVRPVFKAWNNSSVHQKEPSVHKHKIAADTSLSEHVSSKNSDDNALEATVLEEIFFL